MNSRVKLVVAMGLSLVLSSGCASSSGKISPEKTASIKTISINMVTWDSSSPIFFGAKAEVGGLTGGAVGAAVLSGSETGGAALSKAIKACDINLGEIVANEVAAQVVEKQKVGAPQLSQSGGDAQINVVVNTWGMAKKDFSSEYRPLLGFNVEIIGPGGESLWKGFEYASMITKGVPERQYDEYFESPDSLRAAYTQTARVLVTPLVDGM